MKLNAIMIWVYFDAGPEDHSIIDGAISSEMYSIVYREELI